MPGERKRTRQPRRDAIAALVPYSRRRVRLFQRGAGQLGAGVRPDRAMLRLTVRRRRDGRWRRAAEQLHQRRSITPAQLLQ
jgi:hypothetical protein